MKILLVFIYIIFVSVLTLLYDRILTEVVKKNRKLLKYKEYFDTENLKLAGIGTEGYDEVEVAKAIQATYLPNELRIKIE